MTEPEQYDLFGQIAIRNRFTSLQNLEQGLRYQSEEDPYKAIGQILREMGYITSGAIDAVLQVQRQLRHPEEKDPFKAANDAGKGILKRGYATRDQVIECLKEIKGALKAGRPAPDLVKLLGNKGYIDESRQLKLEQGWDEQGFPQIEGYKILAEIRSGGMGTVYKARQLSMHRIVGMKILDPKLSRTDTHHKRFLEEARAQARLNHQNIVAAYDVGQCRGLCYFSMEFVNGESVMELINRDGPIKLTRALEITYEMARALEHVHAHRIIHRDVKPSNILVNHKDESKLCDLGFAKIDDEDVMLGMAGTTLGTPYYMSPEQARGQADVDEKSDIYSLGASLFHMITRRVPFMGKTAPDVMKKHIHEPLRFHARETSLFGPEAIEIVQKMMAKNREDRFPTARAVMEVLAPFLRHEVVGTDLKNVSPPAPLLAEGPLQVAVLHGPGPAPAELGPLAAGIEAAGGRVTSLAPGGESWDALQVADALVVLMGAQDGPAAFDPLFENPASIDGKVSAIVHCGGTSEFHAALAQRLLGAGAVLAGCRAKVDLSQMGAALEDLGRQVCELARHRVAVGGL